MARSSVSSASLNKAGMTMGVTGIAEIKAAIAGKLNQATGLQAKQVFMEAAQIAKRQIEATVPVKTGRLKSAIFAVFGDPRKPNVLVGMDFKKAPHAWVVEHGHGGPHPAPPKPYFRNSITSARPAMAASLVQGMRSLITDAPLPAFTFPTGSEFL